MPTASKKSTAAPALPVLADESPWTTEEVAELRGELTGEIDRLREQIETIETELSELLAEGADGAGRDTADVGSTNFERDQELSLAANARDMLMQAEHALSRFDAGTYGMCEQCGQPIGKGRLLAFPRATMCLECKKRDERR